MVNALIARGANPKAISAKKQSLLWPAVESDKLPLVQLLIDKGADPRALQEDDETLLWAAQSREMAEFLIKAGVDPKHKSSRGGYAISWAARFARKPVVEVLFEKGVSLETVGEYNMRPIHYAAGGGAGEPKPLVQWLLDNGADVNARGFQGQTPLHECALYNRLEMAMLLIQYGADVDAKDDNGRTPKDAANLAGQVERVEIINLLVKRGADGGKGILIPVRRD
jgi:ankyrin repeat protein